MKKHIFCFDGTYNEPEDSGDFFEDSSISNVLKLHAFFGGSLNPLNAANPRTPDQRSYYYSGIGTRGNWLKQHLNAMFAPADGDMDDILEEANADLQAAHVQSDDEIYIFGFSRGAAIARMFAAHIEWDVEFLGVFDTVAAIAGSLDLNPDTRPASDIVFENGTLRKGVKQALHLVALDEKRIAFQPTLFNRRAGIEEVWFPGVHSDIGGGYWFDGLSDLTLKFMLDKLAGRLQCIPPADLDYRRLRLKGAKDAICEDDLSIRPLYNGKLHEQKRGGVQARTLAPRLVRVNVDDHPSADHLPVVHHSVADRFRDVTEYRPYALRNREYRILETGGNIGTRQKGVHTL